MLLFLNCKAHFNNKIFKASFNIYVDIIYLFSPEYKLKYYYV